jgi:hypothetical protein
MRKIEIPHDDWTDALDRFTAVHDAWLVSLHAFTPECGAQVAFEDLPLISISADHSDGDTVRVSVEEPGGHLFTHAVPQPKRL